MKTLTEAKQQAAALAEAQVDEFQQRCREMMEDAIDHSCTVLDLARLQYVRLALGDAVLGANVEKVHFLDEAVACDECGFELLAFGRELLLSSPPATKVGCAACGFVSQLALP